MGPIELSRTTNSALKVGHQILLKVACILAWAALPGRYKYPDILPERTKDRDGAGSAWNIERV
jgi:hypothetical protein